MFDALWRNAQSFSFTDISISQMLSVFRDYTQRKNVTCAIFISYHGQNSGNFDYNHIILPWNSLWEYFQGILLW
jgi:hypothetical protein